MTDVFISYSRKDIAFARLLHQALKENGLETWIDWQDIPPSADWLAEVYEAIEEADAFVFVISETSLGSEICGLEIKHAAKHNKRLIPIVIKDVDAGQVPKELSVLNWIFFEDAGEKFAAAMEDLITAITVDQDWVKGHTRYQNRALDWERKEGDRGLLLGGRDLTEAETWLAGSAGKDPQPTALQTQYVLKSREDLTRRGRQTLLGVGAALVVAVGLGILAWTQRNVAVSEGYARATAQAEAVTESEMRATAQYKAEQERNSAISRSLVMEAQNQLSNQIDLALLLNVEAFSLEESRGSIGGLLDSITANRELERNIFRVNGLRLSNLAVSPDNKWLAGLFTIETVIVWDISNGEVAAKLTIDRDSDGGGGRFLIFNLDGSQLAAITKSGLSIWDVPSFSQVDVNNIPQENIGIRGLSPDFSTILIWAYLETGKPMIILDLETGEERSRLDASTTKTALHSSFSFSPDNRYLVSIYCNASYNKSAFFIWDAQTGNLIGEPIGIFEESLPQPCQYDIQINSTSNQFAAALLDYAYAYSLPDGKLLHHLELKESYGGKVKYNNEEDVLVYSHYLQHFFIHDLRSGKQLDYLDLGISKNPLILDWISSADMHSFFSAHFKSNGGTLIYQWNLQDEYLISETLVNSLGYVTLAFNPVTEAHLLAAAGCTNFNDERPGRPVCELGKISIFTTASAYVVSKSVAAHQGWIDVIDWSPDGKILASSAGGTINLWESESLTLISQWEDLGHDVSGLAFSPDGSSLAVASKNGRYPIYFYDLITGDQTKTLDVPDGNIHQILFSPDGRYLATNGNNYMILDVSSGEVVYGPKSSAVTNGDLVAFSLDSTQLYIGNTDGINIINIDDRRMIVKAPEGQDNPPDIKHISLDPNRKFVVALLEYGNIGLFDAVTGIPIGAPIELNFDTFVDEYEDIEFDPSGSKVATTFFDRGIIVWDMEPSSWIDSACHIANRNLTQVEWENYLGDTPYQKTCPQFP